MADFQQQVNAAMAPGVPGDFASANPTTRQLVLAGPGGLVAGPGGVTIANFAWLGDGALDSDGAPALVNSFGSGPVAGFVHRAQQGMITAFLASYGMVIQPGSQMELHAAGDFWVKNSGTTEATVGQYAYANVLNGSVSFAAANSATAGGTGSASSIAAASAQTVTGSITGDVLTVTAASNTVVIGAILTGTGVATGTQIISQLTGTAGGVGTYLVNIGEQTVASETLTQTYGTLTVGGTVTGVFAVGQTISGSGVTAGTVITALGTGTGGAGTYIVSPTQTASSTSISSATNVQTKWIAMSSGLPGESVKISSQVLG